MAARPLVQVYNANGEVVDQVRLPSVFLTPIRTDIVQFVHTNMRKNAQIPYAVAKWAGHGSSAESWGTGRAVSRIPRVPGGGTHRAGQGAFGNMCRGGRMFHPMRVWRKWHRKVVLGQKRYAVASALAASAVPALVMARGHRIAQIPEVPLVVANEAIEGIEKTKKAIALFNKLSALDDVTRVKTTIVRRAGKGKLRNRPYKERVGPMVVHATAAASIDKALRNLPGVEIQHVDNLNLLRLAPGGHVGRFIIWTRGAFERLDQVFGTLKKQSTVKKDWSLPRTILTNPDINRIIRSDEIQRAIRPVRTIKKNKKHVNPFNNPLRMAKLNPYWAIQRNKSIRTEKEALKNKEKRTAATKQTRKTRRVEGKKYAKSIGKFKSIVSQQ